MSATRKGRRWFAKLGLLVLAVAISLGIVEVLLRTGWIDNPLHRKVAQAEHWRTARARIVLLGDSFSVPHGGLGRALPPALAKQDVAICNLAMSGTGPYEHLARFRSLPDEDPVDLVVLCHYVGNDLTDVRDNPRHTGRPETAIRRNVPPAPDPGEAPQVNLYLWALLRHHFRPPPTPRSQTSFAWGSFEEAGIAPELIEDARNDRVNPWLLALSVRNPNHLLDNLQMKGERNEEGWRRCQGLIRRIHGICQERGAKMVVVVFPRSIQVNDSHFEFFRQLRFHLDPQTLQESTPQDRLAELCEELHLPLLDLLPEFRAIQEQELYLDKDDHLNPEGNRQAARSIVPFLLRHVGAAP